MWNISGRLYISRAARPARGHHNKMLGWESATGGELRVVVIGVNDITRPGF